MSRRRETPGGFRQAIQWRTARVAVSASAARGRSWGLARKLLNIFLRDTLYTVYLRDHFHLDRAEAFYELPLDSITARCLRRAMPSDRLPRWKSVRRLTKEASDRTQAAASRVAASRGITRVHLDAYWWGVRDAGSVVRR